MSDKSYLTFLAGDPSASGKTQTWNVWNGDDYLGTIRWYGSWRQYTFFPFTGTLWSAGCLAEVAAFLKEAMDAR